MVRSGTRLLSNPKELCRWKQVNLLEAEACPAHIHILVEIRPKISVSNFMGFLKEELLDYGFTSEMGNMKYKYRTEALVSRILWAR